MIRHERSIGVVALQWYALLGGPLAWATQLAVGYLLTEAACGAAGQRWGIDLRAWQIAAGAAAGGIAVGAEASALVLWRATRGGDESDPPPPGRIHFIGTAAVVVGVLFIALIVLTGSGAAYLGNCHQS